ncbi:MAG: helix-turn-helix domain-containing protein, partial [Firmicutes bacterium]|nr:helix-turn-helix domain-containing protein [Bacillota bacterium]
GFDYEGDIRVVDTTIKRLRKKMNEKGECIQTVRGLGYKFKE